jgi:hypothetical protein
MLVFRDESVSIYHKFPPRFDSVRLGGNTNVYDVALSKQTRVSKGKCSSASKWYNTSYPLVSAMLNSFSKKGSPIEGKPHGEGPSAKSPFEDYQPLKRQPGMPM